MTSIVNQPVPSQPATNQPPMARPPALRPDCGRCAALCCVLLAFDRSDRFAFDKPAGVACPHVTRLDRCAVHASRFERGFSGCVSYDCLGAGQRVTEELFPGRSWRDGPDVAQAMEEAFRLMRRVHECLLLLWQAGQLHLSAAHEQRREALRAELDLAAAQTSQIAAALDIDRCFAKVHEFLRGLTPYASVIRRSRHLRVLS
jgi:hypothetical protein